MSYQTITKYIGVDRWGGKGPNLHNNVTSPKPTQPGIEQFGALPRHAPLVGNLGTVFDEPTRGFASASPVGALVSVSSI